MYGGLFGHSSHGFEHFLDDGLFVDVFVIPLLDLRILLFVLYFCEKGMRTTNSSPKQEISDRDMIPHRMQGKGHLLVERLETLDHFLFTWRHEIFQSFEDHSLKAIFQVSTPELCSRECLAKSLADVIIADKVSLAVIRDGARCGDGESYSERRKSLTVCPGCFASKFATGFVVMAIGFLPSLFELMHVTTARGPKGNGFA